MVAGLVSRQVHSQGALFSIVGHLRTTCKSTRGPILSSPAEEWEDLLETTVDQSIVLRATGLNNSLCRPPGNPLSTPQLAVGDLVRSSNKRNTNGGVRTKRRVHRNKTRDKHLMPLGSWAGSCQQAGHSNRHRPLVLFLFLFLFLGLFGWLEPQPRRSVVSASLNLRSASTAQYTEYSSGQPVQYILTGA